MRDRVASTNTVLAALSARTYAWLAEDEGQGLTEYALIVALIVLVAVSALTLLGGNVNSELTTVGSSVQT